MKKRVQPISQKYLISQKFHIFQKKENKRGNRRKRERCCKAKTRNKGDI